MLAASRLVSRPLTPVIKFICIPNNICNVLGGKSVRFYAKSSFMKVTIIGAAGAVGQPLSLMLKQSPLIDELAVYDIVGTCGFALELGHVDTRCSVSAYTGIEFAEEALHNSKVVAVVASAPRTSHLSYNAMFEPNAKVVKDIMELVSRYCPKALIAIATNPVNSMLPLASEVMKKSGVHNPMTIFGVTALDVVRANTFVAELQGLEPECVIVPVIGGHADKTIVPVLSHSKPCSDFTAEELEKLTNGIQCAHNEIIKAKVNKSATLSCAFSIARFVISLVKGLRCQPQIIECAYVRSSEHPNAKYLATPLQLGSAGIQKNLGIPKLSDFENCLLEAAIPMITQDVKRGEKFVGVEDPPPCDPCDPDPTSPICPPDWCERQERERKILQQEET